MMCLIDSKSIMVPEDLGTFHLVHSQTPESAVLSILEQERSHVSYELPKSIEKYNYIKSEDDASLDFMIHCN